MEEMASTTTHVVEHYVFGFGNTSENENPTIPNPLDELPILPKMKKFHNVESFLLWTQCIRATKVLSILFFP